MTLIALHNSMVRGLRWTVLAAGALLLTATMTVAQSSDSSGSGKKPVKKAKVVITDDDLPSHAQDTASAPESAGSDSQAGDNTGAAKTGSGGGAINVPGLLQNATLVDAENLLERLKHDLQTLEQRYDQQQKKLESAETGTQRQMYMDSLAHREQTVSRKQKQIEDLEGAIRSAKNSGAAQGDQQHATK